MKSIPRREFIGQIGMGSLSIPLLFTLIVLPSNQRKIMVVNELRLILTVDNLDELIHFYRESLGLKTSKEWHESTGNGIILEAGRASLELIDNAHAARIDQIEVGHRVAGPVRLAFHVGPHIEEVSKHLLQTGASQLANVRQAPWSQVMRLADPAGLQFTLFETSTLSENK